MIQVEGRLTSQTDEEIEMLYDLHLLPSSTGNISIRSRTPFNLPLYFKLPQHFSGDIINSYGGYLKYSLTANEYNRPIDVHILRKYPLVQIHAHTNLVLDYFGVSL